MISVTQGIEYRKRDITIFVGTEKVPCPVCGGSLRVRGTCIRKLRRKDGVETYQLRVLKCEECERTHRELPKGIVPYKRMDSEMLGTIAEDNGKDDLDVPGISTWERVKVWVEWFLTYARHIYEGQKKTLGHTLPSISTGESIRRQLEYSVRLVVNSGNWIQHRSVMRVG